MSPMLSYVNSSTFLQSIILELLIYLDCIDLFTIKDILHDGTYNSYNEIWKQDIKREISNWKNSQNTQYISHKEFLTKVRNENSIS